MSKNSNAQSEEIDLKEILAALWAHKILIFLVTSLFLFFSVYHILNTTKKFTARAIFQIQEQSKSGISLPGDLGALASLAGLTGGGGAEDPNVLLERFAGREFILNLSESSSLANDTYFNTFDPDYKDPMWKAQIKKILGWQKTEAEKTAIIENNIIQNFKQNVFFEKTKSGTIKILVTHVSPEKAANYANNFMEEIRLLVKDEKNKDQDVRLTYLSETLADALQDMEQAQEELKNYALKNSALAQENFISGSLKLDEIRMEKRKVEEIANLLTILESIIKSGNVDSNSYEAIRSSHPLVDDIDFRRILGMSETISAWTWPEVETIEAVSATLRDRIKRLNVEIKNIEDNAKIYATSAGDLTKLTRDAKIAEATYTVLIEQVKSQSLAAGFQPDTFTVFEYATAPLSPSSPNRKFILALGVIFGIFFGCALSIINSMLRGVYYTRSALVTDANAELALKIKSIRRMTRMSISKIFAFISKHRVIVLDEAEIKLANKKLIYIFNSGGRPTAANFARILATQSAHSGRKVVLCDTTGQIENEAKDSTERHASGLPILNINDNISVMKGANESSFFTSPNFNKTVKDLKNHFDQVFICSSGKNSNLGLMALEEFTPSLVLIAGLRSTRKLEIRKIETDQPIDLLFYD